MTDPTFFSFYLGRLGTQAHTSLTCTLTSPYELSLQLGKIDQASLLLHPFLSEIVDPNESTLFFFSFTKR